MSTSETSTVEQLRQLPWVTAVFESDRDDATHRIESMSALIREDIEMKELKERGATDLVFSATPDKGSRLYATVE